MKRSLKKHYPFKVWASILVLSPILAVVWNLIAEPWDFDANSVFIAIYLIAGGAVVSLPGFGLFYLSFRQISDRIASEIQIRIVLMVIGLLICSLTFYLLEPVLLQPDNPDGFRLSLSYLILVPISIFLFKIDK